MQHPGHDRGPSSGSEWLIAGGFLLVVVGLFAAEIAANYSPQKLSALFVVMFWIPLLALHELGHAVVSYALGWHVEIIVIGMGRPIGSFQTGSTKVEVRMFPVEGFIRTRPRRINRPQIESALIYFAGPAVEALVALGVLAILGSDRLFTLSADYGTIASQSLALAAAVHVVMNLVPFAIATPQGATASDGLGIILSLIRPTRHFEAMVRRNPDVPPKLDEEYDPADWWKRGRE